METSPLPPAWPTSQPTQRAALPQASTSPPSEFQMRMNTSAVSDGSMAITWSQPMPPSRSAMARTSASVGRNGAERASTTTKSLPRPFIFRNGRLMTRAYSGWPARPQPGGLRTQSRVSNRASL